LDVGARASEILAAAGWPDGTGTVVVVGHQPTLGRAAALVLTGTEAEWKIKKGAVWWFRRGEEGGSVEVALRAVMSPEFF
jgi:phosphohistidine phosphatase